MILGIAVTLIVISALGYGFRSERGGELIFRHPYNNRYNDASAAREDETLATAREDAIRGR
jgi:hypothetical protein